MAFPTVVTTDSGDSGGNATTYNITIPAVTPGQIILIGVHKDGTGAITWASGWTAVATDGPTAGSYGSTRWHRVDGTEGWGSGGTIQLSGASEGWAHVLYVIDGAHATTVPAGAAAATGTTINPNPGSVSPSFAGEDILYAVIYGWDGNVSHSAYPANYASNQATSRWANTGGCGIAGATRNATTSPEDPGTATLSGAEEWRAYTVAIRPAPAGTPHAETFTDNTGLVDTASGELIKNADVTDNLGLTDAARLVDQGKAVTDNEGLTDAALVDQGKAVTDNLGLTDAVTTDLTSSGLTRTVEDTLGLTDTRAVDQGKVVADNLGLTDTRAVDQGKAVADNLGLTDTVTTDLFTAIERTITDNEGLTDAWTAAQGKAVQDTAGTTDQQAADQGKALADTAGLTDTRAVEQAKVVADNLGLTDTVTAQLFQLIERTVTDNLGLTDQRTTTIGWGPTVVDDTGLVDTLDRQGAWSRTLTDAAGSLDAVATERGLTAILADVAGLSDTVTAGVFSGPLITPAERTHRARRVRVHSVDPSDRVSVADGDRTAQA